MIANALESFYFTPADVTHLSRRSEICFFFAQLQITGFSSEETNNIKSHRWQPRDRKMCCNLLLIIFSLLVHNGDKVCSCLSSS